MKKALLIGFIILTIGMTSSIAYAFISGSNKYREICFHSRNYSQEEHFQKNLYGFENCDPNGIALGSVFEGFVLTIFILHFFLIINEKKMNFRTSILFLVISIFSFIFLVIIEQVLFNTFPSIGYKGWQDAGWTISRDTTLVRDFRELDQRPTALPFDVIVILLFSITTSLGLFLSGLLFKYWKHKTPGYIGIPVLFIISIILQILVYISTFPVTLWMGMSYM